jgi:hypothetical protein
LSGCGDDIPASSALNNNMHIYLDARGVMEAYLAMKGN